MDSYTLSIAQGSYTAIATQIHSSFKGKKEIVSTSAENSEDKKEFRLDSQ
jgi:hypothetical protein